MTLKSFRVPTFAGALSLCAAMMVYSGAVSSVHAEPVLQLYIEGGTYDDSTDTWVFNEVDSSEMRIWAVGAVGQFGTIHDVRMSVVYDAAFSGIGVTLEQVGAVSLPTINSMGFTYNTGPIGDAVITRNPLLGEVTDPTQLPLLGGGSPLPDHGQYGTDRYWQEFYLGDFNRVDNAITDFNGLTDTPAPGTKFGQIDVFRVKIDTTNIDADADLDNLVLHFDLYDHIGSETHVKYKFAPFSHDGGGTPPPDPTVSGGVPTPAAAGMGIIGFALLGLRRGDRRRVPA